MRYEGVIYRPPSEFDSLVIQATIGCPHNRCSFCNMYSDRKFKIRPVADIINDLDMAQLRFGENVEKIFFSDGNTILMKTKNLLTLLRHCYKLFPNLKRVTMYGSAQYINLKTLEEFLKLKKAGLSRIHCGMESGDDNVLKLMNKGFTQDEMLKAATLIKKSNIELSLYYIVGLGGYDLSNQHAVNSGKLISKINPDFIRLRTLIPFKNTPLYKLYTKNKFRLLNPHDALKETKLFVESLDNIDSYFLSDHTSNYCNVNGKFPEDKDKILKELDNKLSLDISSFRSPNAGTL
ncbi:B12-binding domain-containing radical SAM protein [Dethiothermospora halolimnae]|uniref:B12-binding domain-containing radical SAM protein n=1 Tax=Dethiothermospora halolimnae TaxID=3114390 RepID=UPI003CCC41ED